MKTILDGDSNSSSLVIGPDHLVWTSTALANNASELPKAVQTILIDRLAGSRRARDSETHPSFFDRRVISGLIGMTNR